MAKKDLSEEKFSDLLKKYHAVMSEISRMHCFKNYYMDSGNNAKLEQVEDLLKRLEAAETIIAIEIDRRENKWND